MLNFGMVCGRNKLKSRFLWKVFLGSNPLGTSQRMKFLYLLHLLYNSSFEFLVSSIHFLFPTGLANWVHFRFFLHLQTSSGFHLWRKTRVKLKVDEIQIPLRLVDWLKVAP